MPSGVTRAFLTTDAVGGVWTYAVDLARGLTRRGCAVVIAVLGPAPSEAQHSALPPGVGTIPTDLPLDWTAAHPSELAEAADKLATLAWEHDSDLVHLHTPALVGEARYPAPVVASAHSCVATWWRAVRAGPLPNDLAWRRDAVGRGLARAAMTIAPSRTFARALRTEYPGPWPVRVVHNGRSATAAPRTARRQGVLTAGRLWDEGKNAALLDRVAASTPFAIEAAGPAAGPNGTRAVLPHLRLSGQLDETALRARMRGAAVFASPALYEPFGLGVLEAAQEGCALMLSDIPAFRELWDGAALFLPPDDPDAWRETLTELLSDPARTDELGARAAKRSGRYTVDAMVAGTLAAYEAAAHAAALAL